jgi:hypothetical protein
VKKAIVKPMVARLRYWLDEFDEDRSKPAEVPFDNGYEYLRYAFCDLMTDAVCRRKPMYVWGVLRGTALARVLGIRRVSVIEFGVAGGGGLLSLERIARHAQERIGVVIDVYGFDTGTGLPKPKDYRDQPNMWFEGQLPMNRELVEGQLRGASLRIGLVRDTVPQFVTELEQGLGAPVAFVSFDLDLYSSTCDALKLFSAKTQCLLPRVMCYFDDILGHTYNEFAGERLAINEFNASQGLRKLSPIFGLRYFAPRAVHEAKYWDCFYLAHIFDHPLYNTLDSISKGVYMDHDGRAHGLPVNSNWRDQVRS